MLFNLSIFLIFLYIHACNCSSISTNKNESVYKLGQPLFFGSGCQANDVLTTISNDQIVVTFQTPFLAENIGTNSQKRASCNGAIPVTIEKKYMLGLTKVRVIGHVSIPNVSGAYAQITNSYFFGKNKRVQGSKKITTPGDSIFTYMEDAKTSWSKCGESTNIRINSALQVVGTNSAIGFDASGNDGLIYQITWKKCTSETVMME